jgi:hypothetical protein
MDDTLEHPDDGLRDRIRKGFEDNAKRRSKKIVERPKTPRRSNKGTRDVTIAKKVTEISDENPDEKPNEISDEISDVTRKPTSQKKTKMEKKPVVRKPKIKSEVADTMKKLTLKQTKGAKAPAKDPSKAPSKTSANKAVKPAAGVYLCLECDKTYKSKNGIVKHMEKCK